MIENGIPLQEAANYDGDHECAHMLSRVTAAGVLGGTAWAELF
jgi:hypothetical protein